MAHYTGSAEIVLYGSNTLNVANIIINIGASQSFLTPTNDAIYYEGGDNIANEWVADEEEP